MNYKTRLGTLLACILIAAAACSSHLPVWAGGLSEGPSSVAAVSGAAPARKVVTQKGKKYCYEGKTRKTGKLRIGKNWYYFGPEMRTGLIQAAPQGSGRYYYADRNGVLQTGWKTLQGKKYYFWKKSGNTRTRHEAATGLRGISGSFYLFDKKGVLLYGLNTFGGKTYYTNEKGQAQSGWRTAGGALRYFWPGAGSGHGRFEMAAGTVVIEGVTHYLDSRGVPRKTFGGRQLDKYGAVKNASLQAQNRSDSRFFGDVTAGRTPAQKAILSCLNYYEDQLQKLNRANRFEETYNKKGSYPKHVWQYSNSYNSPLNSYFAPFDRMNGGAYKLDGKVVRYCNCDTGKWWVAQDLMKSSGLPAEGMSAVWDRYTIKDITFKDLYKKGYFTVKKNGKNVRIDLVPGTCFYDTTRTHTWIYMGPDSKGVERFFDTGHGGVHSDPAKVDKVLAWEKDLSDRFHTDGRRAIYRTWVNEMTDTRSYADKTIRIVWVPKNLKTFYYRNAKGSLVRY